VFLPRCVCADIQGSISTEQTDALLKRDPFAFKGIPLSAARGTCPDSRAFEELLDAGRILIRDENVHAASPADLVLFALHNQGTYSLAVDTFIERGKEVVSKYPAIFRLPVSSLVPPLGV
jgi:hypothetical protein